MSARVAYPTGGGDLQIEFGVNRWVLVETPDGGSEQRQIAHERELAELLREVGLTERDAQKAAAEAWTKRTAEAGAASARPSESLRRSTGLPSWGLGAVILLFIAVWIVVALIVFTRR